MEWNKEELQKVVDKCSTLGEFRSKYAYQVNIAYQLGVYKEITKNLGREPIKHKWDLEALTKEALKYSTKKEFKDKNQSAYQCAYKKGFLDTVCSHMKSLNDIKHKDIYFICNRDKKEGYVGLSSNVERRIKDHKRKGRKQIKNLLGNNPKIIILKKSLKAEEAGELEDIYICKLREKGWLLFNIQKGGNLGALKTSKWNKKTVKEVLKRYDSIAQFKKDYSTAYSYALQKGFWKEISKHIKRKNRAVKLKVNNKMYTYKELSEEFGIEVKTLQMRYYRGKRDSDLIK